MDEETGAESAKTLLSPDPQSRLEDEVRLRKFAETVLDFRQQEIEVKQSQIHDLSHKTRQLKQEVSNLKEQLKEADAKDESKDKQLKEAQDHIFRLQPQILRDSLTESEAKDIYVSLFSGVRRWVDARINASADDRESSWPRGHSAYAQARRLIPLLREPAKRCIHVNQSDEYHVMAMIMTYLCLAFFSKSFYYSLVDPEVDKKITLLDEMEKTMTKSPRDAEHCRKWKVEALASLANQAGFKRRRGQYLVVVSEELASLLSAVLPHSPTADLQSSLLRTIIEPAADLAHRLHLSTSVFSLKWPVSKAWSRLEVYKCLNLTNNGHVLDLTGTSPTSPSRRNVLYLFDIAPGLFVERFEDGKKMAPKVVCKPTVLVHAGNDGVAEAPTVLSWLWNYSGGLPTS